jgi:hypothetical protein
VLITAFMAFVTWTSCLIIHPKKLEVFAIQKGEKADPVLRLAEDGPAFSICDESVTVLGRPFFYGDSRVATQDRLLAAWAAVLQGIDANGLYDPQKLALADLALRGFFRWQLTIFDLPTAFGTALTSLCTAWYRRWSGLARSGSPAIFFLPKEKKGLGMQNPLLLVRQCQVSRVLILMHSRDPLVSKLLSDRLRRERRAEQKPPTGIAKYHIFRVAASADSLKAEVMTNANDRPMRSQALRRAVSKALERRATVDLLAHCSTLAVQGKVLGSDDVGACPLLRDVARVQRRLIKFVLNGALDCLPSGANRKRWFQAKAECGRCGAYQTLHHVLSNCEPALPLYTWRHDGVLQLTYDFVVCHLPAGWGVLVDLADALHAYRKLPDKWGVESDQRPDLVLFCERTRELVLCELTVPSEVGFAAAKLRKNVRYAELLAAYLARNWMARVVTFEVGARGFFPKDLWAPLLAYTPDAPKSARAQLLEDVSRLAAERSMAIFEKRDG